VSVSSSINWLVCDCGTIGSCRLLFERGLFCILYWMVLSGVVDLLLTVPVLPIVDMGSVFGGVSAVDN